MTCLCQLPANQLLVNLQAGANRKLASLDNEFYTNGLELFGGLLIMEVRRPCVRGAHKRLDLSIQEITG